MFFLWGGGYLNRTSTYHNFKPQCSFCILICIHSLSSIVQPPKQTHSSDMEEEIILSIVGHMRQIGHQLTSRSCSRATQFNVM